MRISEHLQEMKLHREFQRMKKKRVTAAVEWAEFFASPYITDNLLMRIIRDENALWESRRLAAIKGVSSENFEQLYEDGYDEVISFSPTLPDEVVEKILQRTDDPIVVLRLLMNGKLSKDQRVRLTSSKVMDDAALHSGGSILVREFIIRETDSDVLNAFVLDPLETASDTIYTSLVRNPHTPKEKLLEMVCMFTGLERSTMFALLNREDLTLKEIEEVLPKTYLLNGNESNNLVRDRIFEALRGYPEYIGFPDEWLEMQFSSNNS